MQSRETNKATVIVSVMVVAVGAIALLLSLGLALTTVTRIFNRGFALEDGDLGCFALSLGAFVFLLWALRSYISFLRRAMWCKREGLVLKYLESKVDGVVTVQEVSLACAISVSDTIGIMNQLCVGGVCQSELDERGFVIYSFAVSTSKLAVRRGLELDSDPA